MWLWYKSMLSLFSPQVVTNIRNNRNGGIYNIRYTIFSITNISSSVVKRERTKSSFLWWWWCSVCVCGGGGASFSNFWEPKMMSQAFLGPMPKLQLFQFFFFRLKQRSFWCRTLKLTLHDVSSNIQSVEYSVVTSLSWVLVFSRLWV